MPSAELIPELLARAEQRRFAGQSAAIRRPDESAMIDQRLILITLLIQLGVSAAVSSVLARSRRFRVLLFHEDRDIWEKLEMVLFVGGPFMLGVLVRGTVKNFLAADISFEASILLGVIAGRTAGVCGGILVSLPYLFMHSVYEPAAECGGWPQCGIPAGSGQRSRGHLVLQPALRSEHLPLDPAHHRQVIHRLADLVLLHDSGLAISAHGNQGFFSSLYMGSRFPNWLVRGAIYITTVMTVAIQLKVLNNTRIEMKLEEQERLLLQARMEALQSQINPHFLFNTLNSVASLVRFDPDTAREMILKLSKILRRLLKKGDSFVELREELEFIDDYLDIEVIRFGGDKLKVVKELDPASLEVVVPTMLIQPIVENSIKHGLAPKIAGGTIYLRSRIVSGNRW